MSKSDLSQNFCFWKSLSFLPNPSLCNRKPDGLQRRQSPGNQLPTLTVRRETQLCSHSSPVPPTPPYKPFQKPRCCSQTVQDWNQADTKTFHQVTGRKAHTLDPASPQLFPRPYLSLPICWGPDGKWCSILPTSPDAWVEEGPEFLSKSISEGVDMRAVCDVVERQCAGLIV